MLETHLHKESGDCYQLLFITNEESTRDKFVPTAVYIDESGALWSRPWTEFLDRFIKLPVGD